MSTTRRTLLGGMLAAPFLAHFAGNADGATSTEKWGSVSDGWVELRWTPQAQAQLKRHQSAIEPIAPAKMIKDADGMGIRVPVRTATSDPSLDKPAQARGSGRLEGGAIMRAPGMEARAADLQATLTKGVIFGKCTVNGKDSGVHPVLHIDSAEGRLVAAPVPPGQPMKIRITGVPVRPTQQALDAFAMASGAPEFTVDAITRHVTAARGPVRPTQQALDAFTSAFGAPEFTVDTIVGYVTAEGIYTPPTR
ncbi:hypothetical protein [Actinomadura sp. 6N118]|uniref:hypothetical protein n=1 Tax=Actinomadura sp. 6N118 TaxID=3375151 RepID=UPI0037B963B5